MKIKINLNRILFVLSIVALNEPLPLYTSGIHMIFSLGKYMALFYACFLLVKHIKKMNYAIVLIMAYYLFLLYPTLQQGGDTRVWFRVFYMYVVTVIITHVNMHLDAKFVINTIFTVVTVILFINLMYLGIYGPDIINGGYGGSGVIYFVGIRTRIGEFAYIGLVLGLIYQYMEPKVINIKFIVLFLSIFVFSLVNRVTTVLFLMAVFLIIKILADRGTIKLNKIMMFVFYGVLVLNVLMIVFKIQDNFAWFFVDILGEDTTLNSRTIIWDSVILQILGNPLQGNGIGYIYQFKLRDLFSSSLYTQSTHNQFLSILYEAGFIGFTMFFVYTHKVIKKFESFHVNKAYNAMGAMFVVFMISMIVENSANNVLYFAMIMIMYNFDKITKEKNYDGEEQ